MLERFKHFINERFPALPPHEAIPPAPPTEPYTPSFMEQYSEGQGTEIELFNPDNIPPKPEEGLVRL